MWWTGNFLQLQITRAQARSAAHPGPCDADVAALRTDPKIARQLARLDRTKLVRELEQYGAWDDTELADHDQNLSRILWLACNDIVDGNT